MDTNQTYTAQTRFTWRRLRRGVREGQGARYLLMFERNIRPTIEIYRAEVMEVYPERGTCDLRTRDVESKMYREVPWASPFADIDGTGIDFCPVEGQLCYMLATTSNAQEARGISSVILGWSFPEVDGAYGTGRSCSLGMT